MDSSRSQESGTCRRACAFALGPGQEGRSGGFSKTSQAQFFPDNSAGYSLLGDFYLATNDLDKATTEYRTLYHEHPKDLQVKEKLHRLLIAHQSAAAGARTG